MVWTEVLITLLVLGVLICVVNLVFIILLYHRGSLDKLQNALLLSLGCSHFCAGFFAIPCVLLCSLIDIYPAKCKLCIASYLFIRFIMISSLLHLMAVIYERYLKIVHPFWFQSNEYTLLRSSRIAFALWCISLFISTAPLTWWPLDTPCGNERLDRILEYFDYACLALFCLVLLLIIYAFVRMFLVVRTHLLDINTTAVQLRASMDNMLAHSTTDSNHLEPGSGESNLRHLHSPPRSVSEVSHISSCQTLRKQLLRKEAKIVIRFAAMILMFILSWGTYFYLCRLEMNTDDIPILLAKIVSVVMFLNPLIDPWILTVNNKNLQPRHNFFGPCVDYISRGLSQCGFACRSRETVCFPARKQRSSVLKVNTDTLVQVRVENRACGECVTNV